MEVIHEMFNTDIDTDLQEKLYQKVWEADVKIDTEVSYLQNLNSEPILKVQNGYMMKLLKSRKYPDLEIEPGVKK